jgi:hypothetical protein
MSAPVESTSAPPLEPGEICAVVWMSRMPSLVRRPDTMPSPNVLDSPAGFPMV